jgi:putative toxin-antitoxin system antitoxin component (TIGR02293 family)
VTQSTASVRSNAATKLRPRRFSAKPAVIASASATPIDKTTERSAYRRIGELLKTKMESEVDVLNAVKAGLPAATFGHLVDNLDIDARLMGAETTLRRRVQEKQNFTVDESERLVRWARVAAMAETLFGDMSAAKAWLSTRSDYIPGSAPISPIELAATDSGARMVESMMLRTAHGIF